LIQLNNFGCVDAVYVNVGHQQIWKNIFKPKNRDVKKVTYLQKQQETSKNVKNAKKIPKMSKKF